MLYDNEIAKKMYDKYKVNKSTYQKMYNYKIGKTDIVNGYVQTDRSNRVLQDNYIKTFIAEEVSFMVGMPITYSSKSGNNQMIKEINNNIYNEILDTELADNMLTFSEAYELYYIEGENEEREFKIATYTPLNSIAYKNLTNEVELFMYFYYKDLDDKLYMDIIDDEYIYHFDENFKEVESSTPHIFKKCPVGIAPLPNGISDTLYHNIKSLQDNYELLMSDWSNEIGDTRLAYLKIIGATIDEDSAKEMKRMGIVQVPEKGDIGFLTKNISSDFYNTYRNIIKEDIYRVAQHIDNQTQIQSNTSGTMLATRMNCLRIKITTQNQCLINCIRSRLKFLFKYLNIANGVNYNYKDVIIMPQLNLPSNDVETAQILSQLNGKLSVQTGLERLSNVTNGREELIKKLEEDLLIAEYQKKINNILMSGEVDLDNIEGEDNENI
ncbi:phage portal protein [Clostridium tertium]|uniref:Phage portal protein n=1 Tax=Clostridium tertium TaxID=1559 RepID=A0A9X3XN00_9CLOT|nr:phage portal protein [Clostridium tertium]MDC4240057.1 phage portal protein [Clostridium tertium]